MSAFKLMMMEKLSALTSTDPSEVDPPLKEGDGNKQGKTKGWKMKQNNMQANHHWIIKNKEISPKHFGYTLECKCSKCGKKLNLKDAFCYFELEWKVSKWRRRKSLFSVFLCSDCSKVYEKQN